MPKRARPSDQEYEEVLGDRLVRLVMSQAEKELKRQQLAKMHREIRRRRRSEGDER